MAKRAWQALPYSTGVQLITGNHAPYYTIRERWTLVSEPDRYILSTRSPQDARQYARFLINLAQQAEDMSTAHAPDSTPSGTDTRTVEEYEVRCYDPERKVWRRVLEFPRTWVRAAAERECKSRLAETPEALYRVFKVTTLTVTEPLT